MVKLLKKTVNRLENGKHISITRENVPLMECSFLLRDIVTTRTPPEKFNKKLDGVPITGNALNIYFKRRKTIKEWGYPFDNSTNLSLYMYFALHWSRAQVMKEFWVRKFSSNKNEPYLKSMNQMFIEVEESIKK